MNRDKNKLSMASALIWKESWSQREISEHHFTGQFTRDWARYRRKKLSWLAGVRLRRRRRNRKLQPAQRRQPGLRGSAGHTDGGGGIAESGAQPVRMHPLRN